MAAKRTFTTREMANGKIAVYQVTRHYPRGTFLLFTRKQTQADEWIARQTAEDAANRLAKVQAYLAERAARPAPVKIDDGQQAFNF